MACTGYYLAGRFGLLLVIPPDFTSTVWPAAGIALACVLLIKTSIALVGIGLGSFLINLGVSTLGFTAWGMQPVFTALCIALGTVGQTGISYILWRKFLPSNIPDSPKSISNFLLLVAPIGCLMAASTGTTILFLSGIIPLSNVGFTWLTWWVGDVIGVILFTPLAIVFFSSPSLQTSKEVRKAQVAIPTMIVFLCVLSLFMMSTQYRNTLVNDEIKNYTNNLSTKIQEELVVAESKLIAFSAYYRMKHDVPRHEFNTLADILLERNSVLSAIGWTPVVPHSQRKALEKSTQKEGFDNFTITESSSTGLISAANRSVYYPVMNIFPLGVNRAVLGFDLGSSADRLIALATATKNDQVVSTAPIVLVQDESNKKSIILYVPIYQQESYFFENPQGKDNNIIKDQYGNHEPIKKIRGFISGVYSVESILGNVLTSAHNKNYSIRLTDITNVDIPRLFITTEMLPKGKYNDVRTMFSFGSRQYELISYANANYVTSSKDWTSWTILILGFLFAGMLQALLLILTGITQRIQEEVDIKTRNYLEAKSTAEEASKAKSYFLANMSHEFRTPLNAILGFTNLCLKTNLTEKQTVLLQKVNIASDTLMSLIIHTLDYAKIESNNIELEKVDIPFNYLLKKIDVIFFDQAKSKGVNFIIDSPDFSNVFTLGDPLRIEQILLNLCSNALKFTHDGEVLLTLDIHKTEDPYIIIEFVVSDTGVGIEKGKQHIVFDAFQQVDNSTTRKHGGSGLGLAITKQLIELMDGEITFNSTLGVGSKFKVSIPLLLASPLSSSIPSKLCLGVKGNEQIKSDADVLDIENKVLDDVGSADNFLTGKTILVVDDVEENIIIIQSLLEEYGAFIVVAINGKDAIESTLQQEVDVILMDIQMPVMNGYQAATIIKSDAKTRNIPIIAMTANVAKEDILACLNAGMQAHIPKPIDEETLISTLHKSL